MKKDHNRHDRQRPAPLPSNSTRSPQFSGSNAQELIPRALLGTIQSGLGRTTSGGVAWAPLNGGYRTTQSGATFSIKFYGVSASWYGFYDTSFSWVASSSHPVAFYSIDQDSTFSFNTVPSSLTSQPSSTQSNLLLFQTKNLALGEHLLEVSFVGGSGDVPLTVTNIAVSESVSSSPPVVSSGGSGGGGGSSSTTATRSSSVAPSGPPTTIPTPDSASSASPSQSSGSASGSTTTTGTSSLTTTTQSPSPNSVSISSSTLATTGLGPSTSGLTNPDSNVDAPATVSSSKKSNVGAIAGGIVAGILVLLLLALLFFRVKRRRRLSRESSAAPLGSSTSLRTEEGVEPFPAPRENNLNSSTMFSPVEMNDNWTSSSEKARIYRDQQQALSVDPLSPDWPRPMNAKHGEPLISSPSSSAPGMTSPITGDLSPSSPHSARDALESPASSSPRMPTSRPMPPIPVPPATAAPPPISVPRVMGTIQDEDSGIRLMQHSDTGGFVEVLPPSYTAH